MLFMILQKYNYFPIYPTNREKNMFIRLDAQQAAHLKLSVSSFISIWGEMRS